jgi:signal transduction histidine kinase
MANDVLFQARQNRLLAWMRLVQAGFSAAAAVAVGDLPGTRDNIAAWILDGYLLMSVLVVAVTTYWRDGYGRLFAPTFVLDSFVFLSILYLTYGANSPFLLIFVFLVLSAGRQWGWRGAAGATGIALTVFLLIGAGTYLHDGARAFDFGRFMTRIGNMIALGGLLIAFGRHEERIQQDMRRLFSPGLQPAANEQAPIRKSLEHALDVFGVSRGLFVWGDPEEPRLAVAELKDGRFAQSEWTVAPGEAHPTLEGADAPFLFDPMMPSAFSVGEGAQMKPLPMAVVKNPLLKELAGPRAIVLPVRASTFLGWVILPDMPDLTRESLYLGSAVSAQLSVTIEGWRSLMTWRDAAAAEERIRFNRNLHDGILQFLAGTSMQLTALARDLGDAPLPQRERILRLQDDLLTEQRQLRALITTFGPATPARVPDRVDLEAEVEQLMALLRRQWNIEISTDLQPLYGRLSARLAFEVLQILREAVSNAVRHGRAGRVDIRAETTDEGVALTIADDGGGMPMTGEFNMDDLTRLSLGPKSLRARIAQLGGQLAVVSAVHGATLRITLNTTVAGVAA